MDYTRSFAFDSPGTIKYGIGIAESVGEEVKRFGAKKVLIVTDKGIVKAGLLDKVLEYLKPSKVETIILDEAYYCIKDRQTGTVLVPFDKLTDSTRVSSDGKGMYIEFRTAGLPKNRQITVDLLIIDRGMERLIKLPDIDFRVV